MNRRCGNHRTTFKAHVRLAVVKATERFTIRSFPLLHHIEFQSA